MKSKDRMVNSSHSAHCGPAMKWKAPPLPKLGIDSVLTVSSKAGEGGLFRP